MSDELLTIRAAARALGVHENTVRNMADDGRIIGRRTPGGQWRIPADEVVRLRVEHSTDEVRRATDAAERAITELRAAIERASALLDSLR